MQYRFNCKDHGEVTISCSMNEIKEIMPCPKCGKDAIRIYSPIADIWTCSGAYGKKS